MKNQIKKSLKQISTKQIREREGESDRDVDKKVKNKKKQIVPTSKKPTAIVKKSNGCIKRKKTKDDDKNCDKNLLTKKRMASLNASAILAANYEIENYAAKHESSTTETSDSSEDDEVEKKRDKIEPPTMKKEKKDVKMETAEEVIFCSLFLLPLSFPFFSFLSSLVYDIYADVGINLNQLIFLLFIRHERQIY